MSRFKQFKFKGGGLVVEKEAMAEVPVLAASEGFVAPAYIDSRPYCIPASNQGGEPACAGFTTAGYVEVDFWKNTGQQKQFDGSAIYKEAKKVDGNNNAGTSLASAVKGAQKLGFIDEQLKVRSITERNELKFALHKYGVCIAGFMITRQWNMVDVDTGFIGVGDSSQLGGHAVLICYYDEVSVGWQNSWGAEWGVNGFGRMTWLQFEEQFLYGVVLEA